MRTPSECRKILFKIGVELGISPKLISERMLTKEDKISMLNEEISIEGIAEHVKAWKIAGMQDLVGSMDVHKVVKTERHHQPSNNPQIHRHSSCHYAAPFVCADWRTDCSCRKEKTYR